MKFGDWVRQERKRKHLSQQQLAEMTGLSSMTISLIELGKGVPRKANQRKITVALNAAKDRTVLPEYVRREEPAAVPALKVVTNGDAIRAMDDEGLVFLINCQQGECQLALPDRDCYQCKLDWLKRRAKGAQSDGV